LKIIIQLGNLFEFVTLISTRKSPRSEREISFDDSNEDKTTCLRRRITNGLLLIIGDAFIVRRVSFISGVKKE